MNSKKRNSSGLIIIVPFLILFVFCIFYYFLVESAQKYCPYYNDDCDTSSVDYAISRYEKAQSLYQEPYVFETTGLLYYQLKEYDYAYENIEKAIEYIDKYPLYEKIKSITSAGLFEPTDWKVKQILLFHTLGDISTKQGNYKQCVLDYTDMYEVAIENDRDTLEKDKRAFCYYKLGQYKQAYSDYLDEKKWLEHKIKTISDNKLKKALSNRLGKIEQMLTHLSYMHGVN